MNGSGKSPQIRTLSEPIYVDDGDRMDIMMFVGSTIHPWSPAEKESTTLKLATRMET
jgi:hypothetical protein